MTPQWLDVAAAGALTESELQQDAFEVALDEAHASADASTNRLLDVLKRLGDAVGGLNS